MQPGAEYIVILNDRKLREAHVQRRQKEARARWQGQTDWPFAPRHAVARACAHGGTRQSHALQAAQPKYACVTVADRQRPLAHLHTYQAIERGTGMSVEDDKAVVRRSIEEGENRADLDVLEDCHATDYVHHDPGNPVVRDWPGLREASA
jgi:hypothetical protein